MLKNLDPDFLRAVGSCIAGVNAPLQSQMAEVHSARGELGIA